MEVDKIFQDMVDKALKALEPFLKPESSPKNSSHFRIFWIKMRVM